jgi:dTDP-glucose 4,6-dehydratase
VIGHSLEPVPPARTIPFITKSYRVRLENRIELEGLLRLLITGGAGFIGSNFLRMIAKSEIQGFSQVTVIDKLTYAGVIENLNLSSEILNYKFIKGDICNEVVVRELINECDAVINFAAETHVDRSILGSVDFINTNIVGVQVLLDAVKNANKAIRFLQISTDEVYGSIQVGAWDEECSLKPNSPYSASKASGDLLVRAYGRTHDLDVVITRCSNNYGTHQFPEKLIPLFITNILEEKKVPVYGDGQNIRDWVHVDDHCYGIYAALMNGKSGEVYNIGGNNELTNLEITELILAEMKRDKTSIEFVEDRKGHDFRYSVNWTKISSELGYKPRIKFEDGLRDTVRWYKDNPTWWKPLKNRK